MRASKVIRRIPAGVRAPGASKTQASAPALTSLRRKSDPAKVISIVLQFEEPVLTLLERIGQIPLPPYIANFSQRRRCDCAIRLCMPNIRDRWPHPPPACILTNKFSRRLLFEASSAATVTLHVGAGTFKPVRDEDLSNTSNALRALRSFRSRLRTRSTTQEPAAVELSQSAQPHCARLSPPQMTKGRIRPGSGQTDLFITPGYRFKLVDALITNFHLPRSTLLMLVVGLRWQSNPSAAPTIMRSRINTSFFSYGDAMLIEAGAEARCLSFRSAPKTVNARRGQLRLNHGIVETPIFMPVGTYGAVKAMSPRELEEIGAQIILGNTFHLWLRPGVETFENFGGLHQFNGWSKPILTDSGGFQVFSLGDIRKISEEGVRFASPINGDRLMLTPEESMRIQRALNSDVVMIFDECTPYEIAGRPATIDEAADSMRLSLRWAQRSRDEFNRDENPNALFGIVQGGMFEQPARRIIGRLE